MDSALAKWPTATQVTRIAGPVNFTKVFLGNDVHGVIDCGMLRNTSLESSFATSLANQLHFEPLVAPR